MKKSFKLISSLILSLFLIFATLISTTNPVLAKSNQNQLLSLDIYLINDFHGNIAHRYDLPGASTLKSAVQTLITRNPKGSILLGGGDMIQGTLESSLDNGLPTIKILNEFEFDASVLGNHEFNYPKEIVAKQLKTANFPFLSANIVDKNNKPIFKPYTIVERKGIKIAIIGLTTLETQKPSRHAYIKDYVFLNPETVIQKYVKEVHAKGADIIVLLTHIGATEKNGKVKGEIIPTLKNSANIDAVFTAHSHKKVSTKYKSIPVIQASSKGKYIGKIHLIYSKPKQRVIASTTKLYPISYGMYPENKKVKELLKPIFKEINQKHGRIIAENKHSLKNNPVSQSSLGELLTDLMKEASHTQIAFLNAGSVRYNLDKGSVTTRKLKDIFPYKSQLITMNLKGSDIISTVEHGLELKSFGFLRFSGLKVTADMSKPIGNRIVSITTTNGKAINPSQTYFVAANNFIAEGGDSYTNLTYGKNTLAVGNLNKIFEDLFRNKKIIDYTTDHRFVLLNYHPVKYSKKNS